MPGARLSANGIPISGFISAEITTVAHSAADRFQASLALSTAELGWFCSQTSITVSIEVGVDGTWSNLILGEVDSLRSIPAEGLVHLDGRDLTASLIETQTQETFSNHTASEIAILLASRHGLASQVRPTSTLVGRYYEANHDRLMLDQFARAVTEWDLLTRLAQQEGYDVWVSGRTLNFQPQPTFASADFNLIPGECISLEMKRSLALAGDVDVIVKSWDSRRHQSFSQSATADRGSGNPLQYIIVRPNLTVDQASQAAEMILADITAHEWVVDVVIPGETDMSARSILQIDRTGTAFDRRYRVARIVRSIGSDGFVQYVRARAASAG